MRRDVVSSLATEVKRVEFPSVCLYTSYVKTKQFLLDVGVV